MNVHRYTPQQTVGPDNPHMKTDSCKPIDFVEKQELEESQLILKSTKQECQSLEEKQKANWLKNMSSLTQGPEVTSNTVIGRIGHYGKFSFGEDIESSGGGCSEDESSGEEEHKMLKKRKHPEGHSSDESSDGEIVTVVKKKRKLAVEETLDELLLSDSDPVSSVEENDNKKEHQEVPSRLIKQKDLIAKETSQTDSLCLEDEESDENDWDIPEELRVKPAEEYQSYIVSDDELEHHRASEPAVMEKEKLLIRLRWKRGRSTVEKQIMVMSETKFKQIKQMIVKNFKVRLKMMFDGELIKDSDTAESLGLEITLDNENADLIDCVVLNDHSKS